MSRGATSGAAVPPAWRAAERARLRAVLLTPWQWRRNDGSLWAMRLYVVLSLLLVGLPALAVIVWLPPLPRAIALGVIAALVLLLLWGYHFAALMRLDHPHAARHVPAHARTLRVAAVGLWLLLVGAGVLLVLGLMATVAIDATTDPRRRGLALLLAALGTGAGGLYVALALRWWWLWFGAWIVPVLGSVPVVGAGYTALLRFAREQWLAQPMALTPLLLLAMAGLLAALFGSGDALHRSAYARRECMRKIIRDGSVGNKPGLAAYGRWGEWLSKPWRWLADRWLAHLLAVARPEARSALSRAEVVLFGPHHWVRQMGVHLPLLLALGLGFAWLIEVQGLDARQTLQRAHVGMSIGLVSMMVAPVISLSAALWTSRREQALLLLLPGMPRGAALNRALGWRQARQYLAMWLLALPVFALLAWGGDAPHVLAFPVVALGLVAWLWRDISRLRPPTTMSAVWPLLLSLALSIASIPLLRVWPALALPLLGTITGVAVVLAAWRWRRLASLPQALPAGRRA